MTRAFENAKDQIGYCGIWCGSCIAGNGALRELTKRYEEVIKRYDVEEWGPKDFEFKEFRKGLTSIQTMPLCEGCLKGGGNPECKIRKCASSKNVTECSACDQMKSCDNIQAINKMRTGAVQAGLFVKTDDTDQRKYIERGTTELKSAWCSCILFMK